MNILITGVAGLIGSRLADYLIENTNHKIIGVDDLSGGYKENLNKDVVFYKRDVASGLDDIFDEHKPEYVYHLAAYAAEGLSPFIRKYNYQNNLLATAGVVNNCIKHDVRRLIFTSTLAVYGHGYGGVFDEKQVPKPIDPYGVAKYGCEMDIEIAGEQHGLDWCIIRPHNVYGVKQNVWDRYRNVLGIWMYQYMNDENMTIFGDGEQTRAFSFIDDTLEPMYRAGVQDNCSKEIINLGGTKFHSIKEANDILKKVVGGGNTIHLEPRHEVKDAHPTWEKSVELLGYKDNTSLKDGLTQMWNWVKTQPKRHRFHWGNYEIEKGIYRYWK